MITSSQVKGQECCQKRICWSSILAGGIVAMVVGFLLNLLCIGVGLWMYKPTQHTLSALGTGEIVALVASGIISMVCGGWAAGRLSGSSSSSTGGWHGFIMWCVATLLMVAYATTAIGSLAGGAVSLISKGISSSGSAIEGVISGAGQAKDMLEGLIPDMKPVMDKLKKEADKLIPDAENQLSKTIPAKADEIKSKLEKLLSRYLESLNSEESMDVRKELVTMLTQVTGKTAKDVEKVVADFQKNYERAKEKAAKTAEQTAQALASFALTNFFILLIGAASATIGGVRGSKCGNSYSVNSCSHS